MEVNPTESIVDNWAKLPWRIFWPLLKALVCPKSELGRSVATRIVIGDGWIIIRNYKQTLIDVNTMVGRTAAVGKANSGMKIVYAYSKINDDDMKFVNCEGFGNQNTTVEEWRAYTANKEKVQRERPAVELRLKEELGAAAPAPAASANTSAPAPKRSRTSPAAGRASITSPAHNAYMAATMTNQRVMPMTSPNLIGLPGSISPVRTGIARGGQAALPGTYTSPSANSGTPAGVGPSPSGVGPSSSPPGLLPPLVGANRVLGADASGKNDRSADDNLRGTGGQHGLASVLPEAQLQHMQMLQMQQVHQQLLQFQHLASVLAGPSTLPPPAVDPQYLQQYAALVSNYYYLQAQAQAQAQPHFMSNVTCQVDGGTNINSNNGANTNNLFVNTAQVAEGGADPPAHISPTNSSVATADSEVFDGDSAVGGSEAGNYVGE